MMTTFRSLAFFCLLQTALAKHKGTEVDFLKAVDGTIKRSLWRKTGCNY